MIYRILVNEPIWEWAEGQAEYAQTGQRLRGPSGELSDVMWQLRLPAPRREHSHRARYYFTEAGWRAVGRRLAVEARRRGFLGKVIRRKDPPKSDAAYADELQIALLHRRGKR